MTQPTKTPSKIPDFKSYEEEAEFWDTHDLTEFWDETKPSKVKFAKNLSSVITVRLSPKMITTLYSQAQKKGVGFSTLARMWLLERLDQESKSER